MSPAQRLRAFACSPTFTAPPVITGTAKVGQVLAVTDGTLLNGEVTARQWNRNSAPIADATGATYTPVLADVGAALSVTVTATNALRDSNTRTVAAAPTAAVVA